MGLLKSPRPDEFGANFYQKHWHIAGTDVSNAVLSLLNGESINSSLNSTFISLSPKKQDVDSVNDF